MADIVFDGRRVTVPAGTNLVEAGNAAGVPVPIFCYQKDLGAVGACRVCAVTATVQGRSRMVMACMTQAADGMEVTTLDPASIAFRKRVIELLMLNHPHDCPICDEGGECQLQDLTIAAGHGRRRYQGRKRTFRNQHLGEFIAHEMNRCITCYRCSRFYQDYAGGRDFAPSGSRDRVYFGRFEDGPFESPFSGNLVEFCPTGVFTDKLFRYRSRVWDLNQTPSICPHCSVGCNVHPGARYRELQRVRVRENPEVNGVFLCDRGQFGHEWMRNPARPRVPHVRGQAMDWDTVLGVLGGRLLALAREHGPQSIALLSSPRASLETHRAMGSLADGPLAGARVSHFDDPARELRAVASLEELGAFAAAGGLPLDQADIAHCDVLLVAGTSLVDEAPLAALAARQVVRRGGRVFVIGPLERHLADVASCVSLHPAELGTALDAIATGVALGGDEGRMAPIAAALRDAKRPGVLVGHDLVDGPAITAGARVAHALRSAGAETRLGYVFPGPNGFGAALLSRDADLADILRGIEEGTVRAAIVVESDLADLCSSVRAALTNMELLIVVDHVPLGLGEVAHALLPATAPYESDGLFVNRAGRMQAFASVVVPGIPVTRLIQDERFPRQPRLAPPESHARPAWWILERLREATIGQPAARDLAGVRAALAGIGPLGAAASVVPGGPGVPVDLSCLAKVPVEVPAFPRHGIAADGANGGASHAVDGHLALYRLDRTLGSEPLSRRGAAMQEMAGPPVARVSPEAFRTIGGGRGMVSLRNGSVVEIALRADETVPPGVILLPRDVAFAARPDQGESASVSAAVGAGEISATTIAGDSS